MAFFKILFYIVKMKKILSVLIVLLSFLLNGTAYAQDTVCYGASDTLSLSNINSSYRYRWIERTLASTSWDTIYNWGAISIYIVPNITDSREVICQCDTNMDDNSDFVVLSRTITALERFIPGIIGYNDTVCFGQSPNQISLIVNPSGGGDSYYYFWQQSNNDSSYLTIFDEHSTTLSPSNLTSDTYYRLGITSIAGCGEVYSNSVKITVLTQIQPALIASPNVDPICSNTAPDSLIIAEPASGGDGIFSYQWQILDSGVWVDIAGAIGSVYHPGPISDSTSYRLKATNHCGVVYSPMITVPVFPDFIVGALDSVATVCYQGNTTLSFATMPSGGGDTYTYQWLSSSDGITYSQIPNATSNDYATPNLANTMYYKVVVTAYTCSISDTTNPVIVIPHNRFLPGSIMGGDTVCSGTVSAHLQMNVSCTGGAAPYTYQWQCSDDGTTFFNIPNAHAVNYSPDLTSLISDSIMTRYYRLAFTSSQECGTVFSHSEQIVVLPMLHPAILGSTATEPICYNSIPAPISIATAPIGSSAFDNQWQIKQGDSWIDIAGESNTTYQPGPLTATTEYRLASTSIDGCGPVFSQPFTVNVYPALNVGYLDSTTFACHNSSVTLNFQQSPLGGGDRYLYKWFYSSDNMTYHEIPGAVNSSYTTEILGSDTYYKALFSSYYGCSEDTTNPTFVHILAPFVGGEINLNVDSTCEGTKPRDNIFMTRHCRGGGEPYTYCWQMSSDSVNFVDAPHGDNYYYSPDTLYQTTYYRLIQSSNYGCGKDTSSVHIIKALPNPPTYNIIGPDTVCFSQYEIYFLEDCIPIYDFQWALKNNTADVSLTNIYKDTAEIYWREPNISDTICVKAVNYFTGCSSLSSKRVSTMGLGAPPRTNIVRKPNSNILVCEESNDDLFYQWGFTIRSTGEDVYIENSNRRYVLLPHDFDDITYQYWVKISPDSTSPCFSISYYMPSNGVDIIDPVENKVVIPSLSRESINITIENVNQELVYCEVYSITGVHQCSYSLGKSSQITHTISNLKKSNTYIVRIIIGSKVYTQRTFIQ